jgi:hypothetical protein
LLAIVAVMRASSPSTAILQAKQWDACRVLRV